MFDFDSFLKGKLPGNRSLKITEVGKQFIKDPTGVSKYYNGKNGFGDAGEGYFRIALTQNKERLEAAVDRIKKMKI